MSRLHLIKFCGTEQRFSDRYKILKPVGKGGFGSAFLARDLSSPKAVPCVIKELYPTDSTLKTRQRIYKQFAHEAAILQQFECHPQIPPLLDFFEFEDHYFLVQGCALGNTLRDLVKESGFQTEESVQQFLADFLPLLHDVHTHNVIHRDIKPRNIICCIDGRFVLIDFGLAVLKSFGQVNQPAAKDSFNSSGRVPIAYGGTEGFAPTEQIQGYPVDASDIYALGVTCLYLLSGKPIKAFEHDTHTEAILWEKQIHVSTWFGNVLNDMLQPAAADRFPSAMHVLEAMHGNTAIS